MFEGCNLNVSQHRHVEIGHKGRQCIFQYIRPTVAPRAEFLFFLFIVVKPQATENVRSPVKLLFYIYK